MDITIWLKKNKIDPHSAFTPASPADTVLRMLNNLSMLAQASGNRTRALELSDYKLAVVEDPLPILLERVDLWTALGVPDMARRDLAAAIELAPDAASKSVLERRMVKLPNIRPKLH